MTVQIVTKTVYYDKTMTRDEVILANMPLVHMLAKEFSCEHLTYDDFISEGTMGLFKAYETYDSSSGWKFSTYASVVIRNEMLMMIRKNKKRLNQKSTDDIVNVDNEGNNLTLLDYLYTEDDVNEQLDKEHRLHMIYKHFNRLTPKERFVIKHMYGIGVPPASQQEIAAMMKHSQPTVSKRHNKALAKLRKYIELEVYNND